MANIVKEQGIDELRKRFSSAISVVYVDYRGLTAMEMGELRVQLRKQSAEFMVVKNTLAKIASQDTPLDVGSKYIVGPTSIALSAKEYTSPARVLVKYGKENPNLKIKGGVVDGKILTVEEVEMLADMPPKEELMARALGSMNAPVTQFVGVLAGVIRKLFYALKEIEKVKDSNN